MAFTNNDLSIETRFQLDNTPKNFKITDDTDYAGTYGIALTDVEGVLKIVDPNSNIVHQTVLPAVDIDLDVKTYIDSIALPLDSNNEVLKGTYTITYTVEVTGATDPGIYEKTFTYKYCYEDIEVDVDLTVDLICAKLTSTDNTSYPQEVTSTSRTHTVHPPAGLNPTDWPVQTVSTQNNIYSKDGNKIATKTWTGKVVNVLELTYTDGLIVDVTVTGNSERDIQDDINICNLQCNMRALYNRYKTALGTNTVNADEIYRDQLAPALVGAFMYTSNIQCGNFSKAESYYQDVLTFTGSQPDCQCSDSSEPEIIYASCSGSGDSGQTYVVDACGTNNAITVTSNTIGDTTTYTVCFNQTLFNKLSALTETVITSSDSSITVSSSTSGYTKTWDIKTNTASSSSSPVHSFSGLMEIDFNSSSNPPALAWVANFNTVVGDKLQEPTINNSNATNPNWSTLSNCFYLDGYVDQSGGEYPKPLMQIVEQHTSGSLVSPCSDERTLDIEIMQIDTSNNRIYFKFTDRNYSDTAISGAALSEFYDKVIISVIINA